MDARAHAPSQSQTAAEAGRPASAGWRAVIPGQENSPACSPVEESGPDCVLPGTRTTPGSARSTRQLPSPPVSIGTSLPGPAPSPARPARRAAAQGHRVTCGRGGNSTRISPPAFRLPRSPASPGAPGAHYAPRRLPRAPARGALTHLGARCPLRGVPRQPGRWHPKGARSAAEAAGSWRPRARGGAHGAHQRRPLGTRLAAGAARSQPSPRDAGCEDPARAPASRSRRLSRLPRRLRRWVQERESQAGARRRGGEGASGRAQKRRRGRAGPGQVGGRPAPANSAVRGGTRSRRDSGTSRSE